MAEERVSVVLVTTPDEETAVRLAESLVGERLAACANLVPGVRSIYRWEGEIADDREVLMVLKTRTGRLDALRRRVVELHPYDTPEVIALDVSGGARDYLDWVVDSVTASDS